MTRTWQLEAHYAVLQLDNLRREVVMSYRPTVEMLSAEFDEALDGVPQNAPERVRARKQRVERLVRYRTAVLELAAALASLRLDCGTDPDDLPHADDDVTAEYSRIQSAHETHRREQAGQSVGDDFDKRGNRPPVDGYRQISAAGHAAADEALEGLRYGGAL